MCAICGYYCFSELKPEKSILKELLVNSQSRGKDATGIGYIKDNYLVVKKQALPASEFASCLDDIELPGTMIMHCRQATQGKPDQEANNHPIFTKSGLGLVHNGIILNDQELFEQHKLERDGQVDSEIIAKLIEKESRFNNLKMLDEIEGGFTFAAIWTRFPGQLLLVKHDNPLAIVIDTKQDILYFASSGEILRASLPKTNFRGFLFLSVTRYLFADISDNTGLVISSKGILKKFEIHPREREFFCDQRWVDGYYRRMENVCELCGKEARYREGYDVFLCDKCFEIHREWYGGYGDDEERNGILPLR
jgi:predicted glutamine amidotransferase